MQNIEKEISSELQSQIEKKVSEIKSKDKSVKKVFVIVVDGEEGDDKETYVGYFHRPDFMQFSKFLSASDSNHAVAMKTLATDCFIDGDREMIDDDDLFLFGVMPQLSNVLATRHAHLVNLSKPGK